MRGALLPKLRSRGDTFNAALAPRDSMPSGNWTLAGGGANACRERPDSVSAGVDNRPRTFVAGILWRLDLGAAPSGPRGERVYTPGTGNSSLKEDLVMVKPIPEGYSSITPYLMFEDAKSAIDFYGKAFGAQELFRMPMGDRIGHAELLIGNSRIMLADEAPQWDSYGPKHYNGSPISLMLYVEDVDAFAKKAVAAGAKVLRPVKDQFYGDRSGTFLDPFGYKWTIGTHVEDVPPEEIETRMASATA
jgi:PhnB protein